MSAAGGHRALPLAVTMGDPSGIGPEIAIRAWRDRHADGLPPFAVYADIDWMRTVASAISADVAVERVVTVEEALSAFGRAMPIVHIQLAATPRFGYPDIANSAAVLESIERSVGAVSDGRAAAVVTNPIAKSVLYKAGFKQPGHTEYLGTLAEALWKTGPVRPVMMLVSSELRVVPLTIHVPLKSVPSLLTIEKIVSTARVVAQALARDFGIATPRLAIAGLNPHAGEAGALGSEEQEIIEPAITALKREGLDVSGPYSADTMFHAAARRRYDAAIAMYHDQALIPIKTLAFDEGVNVTLGLPFIRTSPDHGTAFDIAGKGVASAASLKAALILAAEMHARRAGAPPL